MGAASCLQALVFMRDFKHPNIHARDNTEGHKQSRRLLECIDNDLFQLINEEGTLLDTILINTEGPVWQVKVKGSLGCKDCEMVEYRILKRVRQVKSSPQPWISGQ